MPGATNGYKLPLKQRKVLVALVSGKRPKVSDQLAAEMCSTGLIESDWLRGRVRLTELGKERGQILKLIASRAGAA